jgi:HAD superfamily hydrolase (TIGR01484 family)
MRSFDDCPRSQLASLKALLTDLDGTLTTGGRLEPETYVALSELKEAGLFVAVVTGRPAGWAELIARTWPVDACIAENGGVTFTRDRAGNVSRSYYTDDEAARGADRLRLKALVDEVCRRVPGARLSLDSRYTEVNLSIDWNEDVKLSLDQARTIEAICKEKGATAVRSNVHVNVWFGGFDKASATRKLLLDAGGFSLPDSLDEIAYIGDAPNDAPMFAAFPLSIGVADVADHLGEIESLPAFVTPSRAAVGFQELAAAILVAKDLLA